MERERAQPNQPKNQNKILISVITVLLLIALIGLGILITTKSTRSNSVPTSSENSSSSTAQDIIPFTNLQSFKIRKTAQTYNCSAFPKPIEDVKTVLFTDTSVLQLINSDAVSNYNQTDLALLDNMLNGGATSTEDNTIIRNQIFDVSCSPYDSIIFADLTANLDYPNVDTFRILLTGDGIGGLPNLNVVFYAKKDGNYLFASSSLRIGSDAAQYAKDFSTSSCKDDYSTQECIDQFILTDTNKTLAMQKAQELLDTFAIDM